MRPPLYHFQETSAFASAVAMLGASCGGTTNFAGQGIADQKTNPAATAQKTAARGEKRVPGLVGEARPDQECDRRGGEHVEADA